MTDVEYGCVLNPEQEIYFFNYHRIFLMFDCFLYQTSIPVWKQRKTKIFIFFLI